MHSPANSFMSCATASCSTTFGAYVRDWQNFHAIIRSGKRASALGFLARSIFTCAILIVIAAPTTFAAEIKPGSAVVIDGDTLEVGGERIRLHGIDAPELGQRCGTARGGNWACGEAAARRLTELVDGRSVACTGEGRDQYDRIIATCRVANADVGATLVREGLAWAYRRYSDDHASAEDAARRGKRGIWQGSSETPWDFRARRWEGAVAQAPRRGCPIKGNINSDGERIYHTPWSPWYDRTGIDERRGERWFCDEAEALAAGWRAARWR